MKFIFTILVLLIFVNFSFSQNATCPKNCNLKGRCINNKCVCNLGYTDVDCGKSIFKKTNTTRDSWFENFGRNLDLAQNNCPSKCHYRGACLGTKCICNPIFTGLACEFMNTKHNFQRNGTNNSIVIPPKTRLLTEFNNNLRKIIENM